MTTVKLAGWDFFLNESFDLATKTALSRVFFTVLMHVEFPARFTKSACRGWEPVREIIHRPFRYSAPETGCREKHKNAHNIKNLIPAEHFTSDT